MLIINDFFKRSKEAISNQMEYLLDYTDGKIVTDIIVTDVVDGFGVINNDDFGEFENV